jgi:hypothetical protein
MLVGAATLSGFSQKTETVTVFIHPVYGAEAVVLNEKYYQLGKADSIRFDQLRFYISSVIFFYSRKITWAEPLSYHLVDASKPATLQWSVQIPAGTPYNQLRFNLGIDSITNVSGVLGGDLDPTLGMYWTWQSGYINVKMEGVSSVCATRLNEFSLHLGGYQFPHSALREIKLSIPHKNEIHIYMDLQKFVETVNLTEHHHVMSPGAAAVQISTILSQTFSVH